MIFSGKLGGKNLPKKVQNAKKVVTCSNMISENGENLAVLFQILLVMCATYSKCAQEISWPVYQIYRVYGQKHQQQARQRKERLVCDQHGPSFT